MKGIAMNDQLEFLFKHGAAELHAGRFADAEATFREMLRIDPGCPQARSGLGILKVREGKPTEAIGVYEEAMRSNPDWAEGHARLGELRWSLGFREAAVRHFRRLVQLKPEVVGAWNQLAGALYELNELPEAETCSRKALQLDPADIVAHYNLGLLLTRTRRFREAVGCYQEVLNQVPNDIEAWFNLGAALIPLGEWDEAVVCYRRAHEISPADADICNNLAAAMFEHGDPVAAADWYRQSLERCPESPETSFRLSTVMLAQGKWSETWDLYEQRLQIPGIQRPRLPMPEWRGEPLAGKRLLLLPEPGIGENLMMMRYADELARRGASVDLLTQPGLLPLFRRSCELARPIEKFALDTAFDYQCQLLSLPRALKLTPETIHAPQSYLKAREIPRPESFVAGKINIGICWAGRVEDVNDHNRSLPNFYTLAPITSNRQVRLHSLQTGPRAAEAASFGLTDPTAKLRDLDEAAAYIQHLDLVITVDTEIAHLAGALGKPTWLLLPLMPDWTWYPYGETATWYPSMRLFRQKAYRDWDEVIGRVAEALEEW
jgi:tetratricopeptide (TPR) repeat protein